MSAWELRTYRASPGRFDDLVARFKNHTIALLDRHGMASQGYWTRPDDPDVLVYLIEHRGDPAANWAAFKADPEWIAARTESLAGGPLTVSIDAVMLQPTELSGPRG